MARIALLSNPRSTGNRSLLPRVRSFCAEHSEIFHYEVESVDQIGPALATIARVRPRVLVINGGDGTVQTVLTELYHGLQFGDAPPPVAVLPNGKTNLIALDLGAVGDPIEALERVLELAKGNALHENIVTRELIALSRDEDVRPTLGMFLGGAGLAETMLYCRNKIYPMGLPNGISHFLAVMALLASLVLGLSAAFLPQRPQSMKISLIRQGQIQGHFSLLIVTTLRKMLLGSKVVTPSSANLGALQLMVVELSFRAFLRMIAATVFGRSGKAQGVHFERGDEIRIEGRSNLILDGELFQSGIDRPIVLRHTDPIPFLRLAAA